MDWKKLCVKSKELQLLGTLNGGQSFRWKKLVKDGIEHWIGVFKGKVWELQQNEDCILYKVYSSENKIEEASKNKKFKESSDEEILRDYFHLDVNLEECYKNWSKSDPYFEKAAKQFYGIRILRQEPIENIFSFICSANNNIARITSMVEKLATFYGQKIIELEGTTYYSFPTIEQLNNNVKGIETKLRTNGFGYRAKYIAKTVEMIVENGGDKWINNLKEMEYEEAKKELMKLTGIGAKVADCICLMSLGHLQSLPVDTHVYQIAARLYMPHLNKKKSVTDKVYNEIGDYFRKLYGPLAGWAHTVLFCADLKKFQTNEEETQEDPEEDSTGDQSEKTKPHKIKEINKKNKKGKKKT